MSVGTRIRERRRELGLSQDELAQKVGYKNRSTIARIESGENDIPQLKLKEIAHALETQASWLLDGTTCRDIGEAKIDKPIKKKKVIAMKISPDDAARVIGKSDQFVRIGLQRGLLKTHGEPIGVAVKLVPPGKRYTYYINPKLLAEFAGITLDELAERIERG